MKFETIEIEDVMFIRLVNGSKTLFSVAPNHGARLGHLSFKKNESFHSVLWEVSADDCKTRSWSKNEILFPFPNRIEDGKYEYEGKSYQLPINEKKYNNAIHGLIANEQFTIAEKKIEGSKASITLTYDYDGSLNHYPHPFKFDVIYEYSNFNSLRTTFVVSNQGQNTLPFGLGWHPYFKFENSGLDNLKLIIPESENLLLSDDRSLPTGEVNDFTHTKLSLKDWSLDDCFRIKDDKRHCELISDSLTVKMDGSEAYKYLQVFTPKDLGTIAIEPMTSGVNVFNNKEGLRELKPNEDFTVFFNISVD